MNSITKIGLTAIMAALLLPSFNRVQAGTTVILPVNVNAQQRHATGSLYDTRTTHENQSHIYCGVDASIIICGAKDQDGRVGSCTAPVSSNPHLRDMIGAIGPYTILAFTWNSRVSVHPTPP